MSDDLVAMVKAFFNTSLGPFKARDTCDMMHLSLYTMAYQQVWQVVLLFAYAYYKIGSPFGSSRKVAASHILVKDEEEATKIKKQIADKTTTFELAAAEHSTCPSGKSGGSLGEFTTGQMVPEFDKVCWSAPVGELQGPIKTQFGKNVIR